MENKDIFNTKDPQEIEDDNFSQYEIGLTPENIDPKKTGGLRSEEDFKLDRQDSAEEAELAREELTFKGNFPP